MDACRRNKNIKIFFRVISLHIFFALCFCCVLQNSCAFVAHAESEYFTYVCLYNNAQIYASLGDFENVVKSLNTGDRIYADTKPQLYNNVEFMTVYENDAILGYAQKSFFVQNENDVTLYPTENATIFKEAQVTNIEGEKTGIILPVDYRVQILDSYSAKTDYTYIMFLYENSVYYGYVPTECIQPDGVSPYFIVVVFVSIAMIGIILALIFIKKK